MKNLLFILFVLVGTSLLLASPITINISSKKTNYHVKVKQTGTYWIVSYSKSLIPMGKQHFANLRINNGPLLTRRLLGFNRIDASSQLERVWLLANETYQFYFKFDNKTTTVSKVKFVLEKPYKVPKAAQNYKPKLIPPATHP
jgi:hypothetical protein